MTTKNFILKTVTSLLIVILLFCGSYSIFLTSIVGAALFMVIIAASVFTCGIFAVRSTIKTLPKDKKIFDAKLYGSTAVISIVFAFIHATLIGYDLRYAYYSSWVFIVLSVVALLVRVALFITIILFSHKGQIPIKLKFSKRVCVIGGVVVLVVALLSAVLIGQVQKNNTSQEFIYVLFLAPMVEGVIGVMLAASWICDSSKDLQKKRGGVTTSKKKERKRLSEEDFGNNYEEKHRGTFSEEAEAQIKEK